LGFGTWFENLGCLCNALVYCRFCALELAILVRVMQKLYESRVGSRDVTLGDRGSTPHRGVRDLIGFEPILSTRLEKTVIGLVAPTLNVVPKGLPSIPSTLAQSVHP